LKIISPRDAKVRVSIFFMFMGPGIFAYEDNVSNQRNATFYALYW